MASTFLTTMRQQFAGYFRLTETEIANIWTNAIFVFDTNALLNLYRYTDATRKQLLTLLESLADRVHIPYQVAHEFFCNRATVVSEQAAAYTEVEKLLQNTHDQLKLGLQKFSRHSQIDAVRLIKTFDATFMQVRKSIKRSSAEHPDFLQKDDPVLSRLADILDTRVRPRPSPADQREWEKWASDRLDKRIPPGFADAKKGGEKALGDGLIWKEILQLAEETKLPVIFVTDDVKEDWWLRISGKTIGPLPALRQEIHEIAQQSFQMYQVDQFMKYANKHFDAEVSNASIHEAAAVGSKLNSRTIVLRNNLGVLKFDDELDAQAFAQASVKDLKRLFESLNILSRHISDTGREISFLRERVADPDVAPDPAIGTRIHDLESRLRALLDERDHVTHRINKISPTHIG